MKRRSFTKAIGALAATSIGGAPLVLLGGCGGGSGGDDAGQVPGTPADGKIPFDDKETLDSLRAKIQHNGYRFTVDTNWVYDLYGYPGTPQQPVEYDASLGTARFPHSDDLLGMDSGTLPPACDARNRGGHSYIGPIQNQAESNSCWAFASADAASVAHNLRNGLVDEHSVILSPMYVRYILKSGSDANLGAFYGLTKGGNPAVPPTGREGACQTIDFPIASFGQFSPDPPQQAIDRAIAAPRIYLKRCGRVYPRDYRETTAQIKAAILKYGAVAAAIAHNAAFKAYRSGVYEDTVTDFNRDPYYLSETAHLISLIGWDDHPPEGGGGCWILRNSWGTSWGEDGYMRIRYFSARSNCSAQFIEGRAPGDGDLAITGSITVGGEGGTATEHVTLTLTGADHFAVNPVSGVYAFQALDPGAYRVTPSLSGVTFTPPYQDLTLADRNIGKIDFTGRKNA